MNARVAQRRPVSRIEQLLNAAARVFISRGYRRAGMSEIAREMGVAPGTVYLYVESKEALFHVLAMHLAVTPGAPLPELPMKTPPPGTTLEMLRRAMTMEAYSPTLAAVLRGAAPSRISDKLEAVITELYDAAYERRDGINLIERSAIDWPELEETFYEGLRTPLVKALSEMLQRGIAAGEFRPVPNIRVAARFIVETIAWFAIHRHGDPRPSGFTDDEARQTVIAMIKTSVLVV